MENQLLKAVDNLATKIAAINEAPFDKNKPFIALPEGYNVHNLNQYLTILDSRADKPNTVQKEIRFNHVDSFLVYFNQFRAGHKPQLFTKTDDTGVQIMAIMDYDESSELGTEAKWGDNKLYLALSFSRDYKAFRDKNNTWFTQEDFALFVEEYLHLFIKPEGAAMLEIAQHLKGTKNVQWQSGKSLRNGATQLEYIETVEAQNIRQSTEVPEYVELKMPMYEGFGLQDVKAALRWKLENKEIKFSFRLLTKQAEEKAENEVKESVKEGTGLPLLGVSDFRNITAR